MKDSQYLPIIFIRGYAGTQKDVEEAVNDPFYGFNQGSSHIRVGEKGIAEKFFFESPLLRLMTDHGYRPVIDKQDFTKFIKKGFEKKKSIWIYRFYDVTTNSFGSNQPVRKEMEDNAKALKDFIQEVKSQTGASKIYLIAHSMGGLICRSMIQKIYLDNNQRAEDDIDKIFTYATPHGGILFDVGGGLLDKIRDQVTWNNVDDFGPQRMYEYLTPHALKKQEKITNDFDSQSLNNAFPTDRFFSLIGTNAHDYEAGSGMTRNLVGHQSDGLVLIKKAYVKGTHRAHVYRTHTGRYGILNSEEGYQNLQRFLFGDTQVKISLNNVELKNHKDMFYQMEVEFSIRGLPIVIDEQTISHYSPIPLEPLEPGKPAKPTHLFTAFLQSNYSATEDNTSRYAVYLALYAFKKDKNSLSGDRDHIEKLPLWSDHLIVDTQFINDKYKAKYTWLSEDREPKHDLSKEILLPIPPKGKEVLGNNASVNIKISPWS
jgi:PGAP1-like protein